MDRVTAGGQTEPDELTSWKVWDHVCDLGVQAVAAVEGRQARVAVKSEPVGRVQAPWQPACQGEPASLEADRGQPAIGAAGAGGVTVQGDDHRPFVKVEHGLRLSIGDGNA